MHGGVGMRPTTVNSVSSAAWWEAVCSQRVPGRVQPHLDLALHVGGNRPEGPEGHPPCCYSSSSRLLILHCTAPAAG